MISNGSAFSDLIGEEISAVCFVRDFIELHFSGPILRGLAYPLVLVSGEQFDFAQPSWRNAMCLIIGAKVCDVEFVENQFLRLATTNGCEVIFPVSPSEGESIHFVPQVNGPVQIW